MGRARSEPSPGRPVPLDVTADRLNFPNHASPGIPGASGRSPLGWERFLEGNHPPPPASPAQVATTHAPGAMVLPFDFRRPSGGMGPGLLVIGFPSTSVSDPSCRRWI
ncbi:predicted protein [Aspergillus terreus NIH2624]|uniref:Uncharacterized protein n=1 Tax=Aspergillus terreus (strain NIH 2624 / FGSC A1156) TaxID=341663 RepID=Q0C8G0_ASPTN|nr:uncharacterized protein ATEG_10024 [Aspergillus terreus NIH2624]EAU29473.1 predicted protein [Aspergillus terreus NIH2624]